MGYVSLQEGNGDRNGTLAPSKTFFHRKDMFCQGQP